MKMTGQEYADIMAKACDSLVASQVEVARLRKGIQDYIDGTAPVPIKKTEKCVHGRYGYEDCGSCIDDYFANLLLPDEPSLPDRNAE